MKILHIANSTRCSHIISQGLTQRNIDFDVSNNYVSFGMVLKKRHIGDIQSYDYLICGNTGFVSQIEKNNLWDRTIFYEFRDSCAVDNIMLKGLAYFKRSVTCGEGRVPIDNKLIFPLNHCALEEFFLDDQDRTYDVGCFFDVNNHRLGYRRKTLIERLLETNPFPNSLIGTSTGHAAPARLALFQPPADNPCLNYIKMLGQTKIVFTAQPGPTDGDWRTWEAFAAGTLVFKDLSFIPTPQMPTDSEHCFTFDASNKVEIDKAVDVAKYYLRNEAERNEIATAGKEHIRKFHMAGNRVDQILEVIDSKKRKLFI